PRARPRRAPRRRRKRPRPRTRGGGPRAACPIGRRRATPPAPAARRKRRRAAARGRQRVTRVAIIDGWGGMVRALPVWKRLDGRVTIAAFPVTLAEGD